jgi:predicted metal-dependent hydrolase
MTYDARYLKGIEHFNRREFYDAHEIWEELWHEEHGEANAFVQGLIQFATALHHFEAHNLKGAKLLYTAGVELLLPYGEIFWGLPVRKLIDDMTACFKNVLPYKQADLPGRYHPDKEKFPVQLNEKFIPKIELIDDGAGR